MRGHLRGLSVLLFWGCSNPTVASMDAAIDARSPDVEIAFDATTEPNVEVGEGAPYRSSLYPNDWTPGWQRADGARLHDFSYAGYHNSDALPQVNYPQFSVLDQGADRTGVMDSADAIRRTLALLPATGGVVYFPAGTYRVGSRIVIRRSRIVLRGEGVSSRLLLNFVATDSADQIGFVGAASMNAVDRPLAVDADALDQFVLLANADEMHVGDDIEIGFTITDAYIADHAMQAYWGHPDNAFHNEWQVFARRKIVRIAAAQNNTTRVEFDVPLRERMLVRDNASLRVVTGLLEEVGVEHLSLGNALASTADATSVDRVAVLGFRRVRDAWVHDVASFAVDGAAATAVGPAHLQSGGIRVRESKRLTLDHVALGSVQSRGDHGNGYLFETLQSNEVLIRDSSANGGRHNFIQNWGFGTSGCVWLRVTSAGGRGVHSLLGLIPTDSEYHHSLATANLVDSSQIDDGWVVGNRRTESTYAGHAGTENVFWNVRGSGRIRSFNWQRGFIIGTSASLQVVVTQDAITDAISGVSSEGTQPVDEVEFQGRAEALEPASLYQDQLARRIGQ